MNSCAMNSRVMNSRLTLSVALVLSAGVLPAFAQDDLSSLPAVQAVRFVADCAHPVLPEQREVADWTGLDNFGQVYAARGRLMLGIARACQAPGVERVRVVTTTGAKPIPDSRVTVEGAVEYALPL